MSFDRDQLAATIAAKGPVARVVVADVAGSTPREAGASMLVWVHGQSGTIGGGTLEHEAAARARSALQERTDLIDRLPLGPALGQCCGGSVTLLTEVWDAARLGETSGDVIARPTPGAERQTPLAVRRLLAKARNSGIRPAPRLLDGWMIEPLAMPARHVWLWGAGHVGRAIASVLAPLPDLELTWIDTGPDRFPETIPTGTTRLVAATPPDVVRYAPPDAEHLILTYSHAIDLELCHALLGHGFKDCGLIGSATKWARFRTRLHQLGNSDAAISRIRCPIGDPGLGKHPQAIAVGVATALLSKTRTANAAGDMTGDRDSTASRH